MIGVAALLMYTLVFLRIAAADVKLPLMLRPEAADGMFCAEDVTIGAVIAVETTLPIFTVVLLDVVFVYGEVRKMSPTCH